MYYVYINNSHSENIIDVMLDGYYTSLNRIKI